MLGCAKHIHDIGHVGQAFQIGIRFLAQDFGNHGPHRDDAVTVFLQTLRDAKTGAGRIGRQAQNRYAVYLVQQAVDLIGFGIGESHGEIVRCSATIIYHRNRN